KWQAAAQTVGDALGLAVTVHVIGPRQRMQDHLGDWARASEVGDSGCVLVRPDHHVGWRVDTLPKDPAAELDRVLRAILNPA
ncbi:MAG: 2,4-dichlorophenol 6-monooxygenase, partial [Alphaproteobacteria bacterium]|nr:2,4-dichlorophenol 6-monooxygenase [Alphaproteobacteria bacterium]